MKLTDKVAIVTGAGGGIGRATALKLSKEGAVVMLVDINEQKLDETASLVEEIGGQARKFLTDVSDYQAVADTVHQIEKEYGHIDISFNNAGIGTLKSIMDEDVVEDFDDVLKVNLYGVFYCIVEVARSMIKNGIKGSIINTCSVYAFMAAKGLFGYTTSKGGIASLTQTTALELAPYGIRVNAIAPGRVDTAMLEEYRELDMWDLVENDQMRRKAIQPEQVADVVAYLAGDESSAVNSEIIAVDDGFMKFKMHYPNL